MKNAIDRTGLLSIKPMSKRDTEYLEANRRKVIDVRLVTDGTIVVRAGTVVCHAENHHPKVIRAALHLERWMEWEHQNVKGAGVP